MAEGWTRYLKADSIVAHSAGIDPAGLDPRAVRVMREAGVDIGGQRSKSLEEIAGLEFDFVVTVCERAQRSCPIFPGNAAKIHVGFDDPPRLAAGAMDEEAALEHYRRVRDEIRNFVETLPGALEARR
jgi:arsenate reductase